jgi:Animal haem peroxidase
VLTRQPSFLGRFISSYLQDLFVREHNAIADAIAAAHSDYGDQKLFDLARLALAAVVAKIHTVDWTPELLKTSTGSTALNGNWYGLLGLGTLGLGLVGKKKAENHGVPYALTEEFTAVYRCANLRDANSLGCVTVRKVSAPDLCARTQACGGMRLALVEHSCLCVCKLALPQMTRQ